MTSATVIDANCMKYFQEERVTGTLGVFTEVIDKACAGDGIAIDDEGKAQQEYFDCCRPSPVGLNLTDWITDQIIARKIKMVKMDKAAEPKLKQLGVPRKDLKWPSIAKGAAAESLVTEDIDLFDPKAKNRSSSAKSKIKERGGPVSKHLKKKYGICVYTACDYISE